MKKPSDSTIKKCKRMKRVFGLGEGMLYQIVSLKAGFPNYPKSNPFNKEWEKYDPYKPSEDAFKKWYGDNLAPEKWASIRNERYSYPYEKTKDSMKWFATDTTTLHAVPFLRDNIKPTTFTVAKRVKSFDDDLRMFINFPHGLPIIIP